MRFLINLWCRFLNTSVAQSVEPWIPDPKVGGSIPSTRAMKNREQKYKEIKKSFEFDYKNSRTNVGKNFFFQLYWFSIGWLFDNSKEKKKEND